MKTRINTILLLTAFVGSIMLLGSGCSKKTVIPPDGAPGSDADTGTNIRFPLSESGFTQEHMPKSGTLDDKQMVQGGSFADQQSDEYKRLHGRCSENLFPVYFDFDQAGIRPDMVQVLAQNPEYLKSIQAKWLVIEGNSDERGTNEYNMALGERRAINVQQYIVSSLVRGSIVSNP